jgi:hypothetical protein
MKQTAVEWLFQELDNYYQMKGNVIKKEILKQAKEMEKQQGYSLEDLECAWDSSDQNMRFQFSSSAYKAITFKQWLEKFKEEKDVINR